jgi:hypothetical protein
MFWASNKKPGTEITEDTESTEKYRAYGFISVCSVASVLSVVRFSGDREDYLTGLDAARDTPSRNTSPTALQSISRKSHTTP